MYYYLTILPLLLCFSGAAGKAMFFLYPDPANPGNLLPAVIEPDVESVPLEAASVSEIRFYLLTKNNIDNPIEIQLPDLLRLRDRFDTIVETPLKFLIHGFAGSYKHSFPMDTAKEYVNSVQDLHVIMVDWSPLAAPPNYQTAARNTKLVGQRVAALVRALVALGFTTLSKTHLVGFSLGAHIVGVAGNDLQGQVGRITGLDPALPLFAGAALEDRLDPSDAQFVDVIHTAGGSLWEGGLSFYDPLGHADFYPNSGRRQPGCESERFSECSHGRSCEFFRESITTNQGFYSCPCVDWASFLAGRCECNSNPVMGSTLGSQTRGKFWLRTKHSSPFALGTSGTLAFGTRF